MGVISFLQHLRIQSDSWRLRFSALVTNISTDKYFLLFLPQVWHLPIQLTGRNSMNDSELTCIQQNEHGCVVIMVSIMERRFFESPLAHCSPEERNARRWVLWPPFFVIYFTIMIVIAVRPIVPLLVFNKHQQRPKNQPGQGGEPVQYSNDYHYPPSLSTGVDIIECNCCWGHYKCLSRNGCEVV